MLPFDADHRPVIVRVCEVFRLYRDGVVTGDDEVAIVHGDADIGHGALSEPLVNIRVALRESAVIGVVTAPEAAALLDMAAGEHPSLCPHGPGDAPIGNVGTHPLRFWRAQFSGREVGGRVVTRIEEVTALMVAHRDFPAEHRRQVLADLVARSSADPDVEPAALDLARRRGLSADNDEGRWLLDDEAALPDDERLCRLVVRAFGTNEYSVQRPTRLPATLDVEPVLSAARVVAAEAAALNERLPPATGGGPGRRMRFRDEVIDRVFADLWGGDAADLRGAVWDRGFASLESFREAAEPFVAYLKFVGRPAFPAPWDAGSVRSTPSAGSVPDRAS